MSFFGFLTFVLVLIVFGLVGYLGYKYPRFRRNLTAFFNWILFWIIPACGRGFFWSLRETGKIIADLLRFLIDTMKVILKDTNLTKITAIFLLLIGAWIAFPSVYEKSLYDETAINALVGYGIFALIVAISTIVWIKR